MRPRVQPQLMFEVGVSHTASARSVDSERRRPSDGRLRRERAGADGQQCERDRAHRVLRLAGQSGNGGASGSLLGRTQGPRHFTPAKRRLPAAWLEPLSSGYQSKYELARGGGETRGSSKLHGRRTHFREVAIARRSKTPPSVSALTREPRRSIMRPLAASMVPRAASRALSRWRRPQLGVEGA